MGVIWVDADACPVVIRDILYKAAMRTHTSTTLVANHYLKTPPSPAIHFLQVGQGFDEADKLIAEKVSKGDLVISGDIPLADEVISKGGQVLNTRGQWLTKDNIKSRLNMRDFMETLRSSGIQSGGPAALGPKERQAFANGLDQWLAKNR